MTTPANTPPSPHSNASSTPPRLPALSAILTALSDSPATYSFLVPSYRGYWTSTGRPSQRGIEKDLAAIFTRLAAHPATHVVLWGQSIGCGIALKGWADHLTRQHPAEINIAGLLLETPFVSIPRMLRVLYPERWLPYRYLAPFLRNKWDLPDAAETVARRGGSAAAGVRVLLVSAGRDEVVPARETAAVEGVLRGLVGARRVESVVVRGALHGECAGRAGYGRGAIVRFLRGLGEG